VLNVVTTDPDGPDPEDDRGIAVGRVIGVLGAITVCCRGAPETYNNLTILATKV
jgi:hypothetical protein